MSKPVVFLSIPGLRPADLQRMPTLAAALAGGASARLRPSFPAVTWPVHANMITGRLPAQHGIIANGFYWRQRHEVEMWTAGNEVVQQPQVWDLIRQRAPGKTAAAWFPMLSKRSAADYICMPAPIHQPDGSERMWCHTKPEKYYEELLEKFGHFPLHHFWGPLAGIQSSQWIADSAIDCATRFRPDLFWLYLPHLDYAAQRTGPDSPPALQALNELDQVIGSLTEGMGRAYGEAPIWLVTTEYVITPVQRAVFPNRVLREEGLLNVVADSSGEQLDLRSSAAWALVDHQAAHVFVRDSDAEMIKRVASLFSKQPGIEHVLYGDQLAKWGLNHPRSGDIVLAAARDHWFAYYWWLDDSQAPQWARTVDIHRKPGYDPVELHVDRATRSIPLNAGLVSGSHGAPAADDDQLGLLAMSVDRWLEDRIYRDTDVCDVLVRAVVEG